MKKRLLLLGTLLSLIFALNTLAKINFQATVQDKIDIESLDIDKNRFFNFVDATIQNREPGLGSYGRVPLHPCDIKFNDMKLVEYKTLEGKDVKFLSNPSCDQIVIRQILENSYDYKKSAISSYKNRQCILSVEKIISPLLEYYTLKYEERAKGTCNACEFKEKERLDTIMDTQEKILEHCQSQSEKVMAFIRELDAQIENSYRKKTSQK